MLMRDMHRHFRDLFRKVASQRARSRYIAGLPRPIKRQTAP